jgi:hypothetical protein
LRQEHLRFFRRPCAEFDDRDAAAELDYLAGVRPQQLSFHAPQVVLRRSTLLFEKFSSYLIVEIDRRYPLGRLAKTVNDIRAIRFQWFLGRPDEKPYSVLGAFLV